MKIKSHISVFGLLALLLAGCGENISLPPEGFAVQSALSTNELHVGDVVTLALTARHPEGSTVLFPNLGKDRETVVEGRSSDSRLIAEGILETEEIVRLTSFRIGNWTVTTHPVVCTFADGTEKAQALPNLILHVESTLSETNAATLSDIKDIVKPPLRISPKIWVPLFIVLLAVLAGLLTLFFLNKPRTILQMPPPEPPHIIAARALKALHSKPWKPEPFFTELSAILRRYLEGRFSINAPDLTTEELTETLPDEHRKQLMPFFEQSDLVKFANADAEQDIMQTAFETVEQFVGQTAEYRTPNKEPQNEES